MALTFRWDITEANWVLPNHSRRSTSWTLDDLSRKRILSWFTENAHPQPPEDHLQVLWRNHVENHFRDARAFGSYNYRQVLQRYVDEQLREPPFDPAETEECNAQTNSP